MPLDPVTKRRLTHSIRAHVRRLNQVHDEVSERRELADIRMNLDLLEASL